MKSEVLVAGPRVFILPFAVMGWELREITEPEELENIISDYKMVILPESLAEKMEKLILEFDSKPTPVIIVLPDKEGSAFMEKLIRERMIKALGTEL